MHRLPKIFTHKSDRRKSSINSGLSSQAADRPKPKLDRCNASKNINYEYSPASTSASSSSSSYFSSDESLRMRSLELYGGKTSIRIDGVEGEIEILCKTLGFSGIEDFAIPEEEYAAMKMRSSSAPVLLSKTSGPWFDRQTEVNYDSIDVVNRTSDAISTTCEEIRVSGENVSSNGHISFCSRLEDNLRASDVVSSDNVGVRLNEFRGNGIKGVRPRVLVPPPLMSLPVIDKDCSTWDMFRAFAPDSTTSCSRFEGEFRLNGDEERTGEEGDRMGNDDAEEEDMRGRGTRREEKYVLSESYSFTTSSNDDSSSTTTPMSSNSPNRRFRCVIEGWQKGELLGRGSFGSVYEGIADDGFFFAVKEVSLLDQEDDGKQRILQLEQEIALLSQFEHENIVRYYGTKKVLLSHFS